MVWTEQAQQRCFESIKPVTCDKKNGTAFPVFAEGGSIWYVTCAHVLEGWSNDPTKVTVGGVQAGRVINGSNIGLDLALIRIDMAKTVQPLSLYVASQPPPTACIPGCYHPDTNVKSYLRHSRNVQITGERIDVISPDATCDMKGWKLDVEGKEPLVEGYSGSPAICAKTGRVFAVAVMKTGGGGIAICISNLAEILPSQLNGVLPEREKIGLEESIRNIFDQLAERITIQDIQVLCRHSAALPDLDWPEGGTVEDYSTWLLNKGQFNTGRHPLYDVLVWLENEKKADTEQSRLIRDAKQRLAQYYPGLITDPLPAPVVRLTAEPAVIEIVFEPRGTSEEKDYDVHSFWHSPAATAPRAGPRREREDGGRLDPTSAEQIADFAGQLLNTLDCWDIGAREVVMFLFRLPTELLLHPMEQWPQDRFGSIYLGRDYPVVLALRERRQRPCREFWERITPRMKESLRKGIWFASSASASCEPAEVHKILDWIDQATCVALTQVPDLSDPRKLTSLAILIERGVAIAFWPRHQDAEFGFREALDIGFGDQPLANLPYALRNLRRENYGREKATPVARHVALLWDDPKYHRKRSFPGLS